MSFITSGLGRLVAAPATQSHLGGHSGTTTLTEAIKSYDDPRLNPEPTIRIPTKGRSTGKNTANGLYTGQSVSPNASNIRLVATNQSMPFSSDRADTQDNNSLKSGHGTNSASAKISSLKFSLSKDPAFLVELEQYLPNALKSGHGTNSASAIISSLKFSLSKDPAFLVELEQYLPKPIHMWNEKDCESWLSFVSHKRGLGTKIMDVFSVIPLVGIDLLRWTLGDFSRLFGPSIGLQIVEELVRKEKELAELLATGGSGAYIQRSEEAVGSNDTDAMTRSQPMRTWEFIAVLLAIPSYNPTLIRWVKEEEGLFRIVNTIEVFKLWCRTMATPALLKHISHVNSTHGVNGEEEKLKLKLGGKATWLLKIFLWHLREDCRAGLIFKTERDKSTYTSTYRLGHQALELHRELRDV